MSYDDVLSDRPIQLGIFLTDGFSFMSYASVMEPFRAANILSGRRFMNGRTFRSMVRPLKHRMAPRSSSIRISASRAPSTRCSFLPPVDPALFNNETVFAWLRDLARRQVTIAGLSGGPFLMARAGLLDDYRATIHWEHRAALEAEFPLLDIDPGLYVIDRRRLTCAGGTAGLDLALELIEREQGQDLAGKVSEWFIRSGSRAASEPQRLSLRERYDVHNDRVLKVLALMETAVEDPVSREQLAVVAGVSMRQLERLFADHLGATVNDIYMRIRLDQAGSFSAAPA